MKLSSDFISIQAELNTELCTLGIGIFIKLQTLKAVLVEWVFFENSLVVASGWEVSCRIARKVQGIMEN
mgnify:CR=1 FL=1